MFHFTVRHLRGLTRVPGLPHLFDALLLAWSVFVHPGRRRAMEALEAAVLRQPGIRLRVHRLGGVEFVRVADNRELGHLHGNGLLDVRVGRARTAALIEAGRARAHHVRANAGWVSFPLETPNDVPAALWLMGLVGDEPPPGAPNLWSAS